MHILIADTKRPPKIIFGEWPRYTEAALCRVYAVAALYGGRVMPRIRSGRVIRRPRFPAYTEWPRYTEASYAAYTEWPRYTEASYAAYTEWPRYTEAALCRVYAVAALYGGRVMPRIRSGRVIRRPRYTASRQ